MTPGTNAHGEQPAAGEARLLSAHFAIDEDDARSSDAIVLVFSDRVDPLGLRPESFLVVMKDGTRVSPGRAMLAPADEHDEHRTVTLLGAFGNHEGNPPTDVAVVGPLFTTSGLQIGMTGAELRPYDEPDRVVAAEVLAAGDIRCPEATIVVRTYWTDLLSGIDAGDLDAVRVRLDDGTEIAPVAFDDHGGETSRANYPASHSANLPSWNVAVDDNVLDLCLSSTAAPVRFSIRPETFSDAAGHPTAAVDFPL